MFCLQGAHRVRLAPSRRPARRRRRGRTVRIRQSRSRVHDPAARAVRGHRRGAQRTLGRRGDRAGGNRRRRVLPGSQRNSPVRLTPTDENARDLGGRRYPGRDIHHADVTRRVVHAGVRCGGRGGG